MKSSTSIAIISHVLAAQAIRIVQSNDDGWAESYIREFNSALIASGHDVILSAPADDQSASGSLDEEPSPRSDPCEYNSCPANSGPVGFNSTRPDLNWVNSKPVTAARFGIDQFGPAMWNGEKPEFVVSGPNVGSNVFLQVQISGTIGVAAYAAHNEGIPSIAFSGASTGNLPWDVSPVPLRSTLYAELAAILTNRVIDSGKPYLPDDVFLNVNFPEVEGPCMNVSDFGWVLSRIDPGFLSPPDVEWCGSTRLPTETSVLNTDGCFISVSIGDASDKTTINDDRQDVVLAKLKDMLSCLNE